MGGFIKGRQVYNLETMWQKWLIDDLNRMAILRDPNTAIVLSIDLHLTHFPSVFLEAQLSDRRPEIHLGWALAKRQLALYKALVSKSSPATFDSWFEALSERSNRDLTFQEIRKSLQALSKVYVQRRDKLARGAALDTRGKRTAFGLFYAPIHYLFVQAILKELDESSTPVTEVVDLGCGTGVAGAAWAMHTGTAPPIRGYDLNRWAVSEARWTYQTLGLRGTAKEADVRKATLPGRGGALIATYTVNELPEKSRDALLKQICAGVRNGMGLLIIEPIAKSPVPWWSDWAKTIEQMGGSEATWQLPLDLPEELRRLDKAARMHHDRIKGRTLWVKPG